MGLGITSLWDVISLLEERGKRKKKRLQPVQAEFMASLQWIYEVLWITDFKNENEPNKAYCHTYRSTCRRTWQRKPNSTKSNLRLNQQTLLIRRVEINKN